MGAWGPGIMESDTAQDARVAFEQGVDEQPSLPAALAAARARLEARLADAEEGPELRLALAWLVAARGRVPRWLRDEAAAVLREEVCLRRWADAPDYARRREEEARLLAVLEGRAQHPEAAGQGPRARLAVGDVVEIPLPDGRKGYGRYVHWDPRVGPLLQVYDLIADDPPPLAAILAAGPKFPPVITGVQAAVAAGLWRVVGHAPVRDFVYPTFRNGLPDARGRVAVWYLYDGREERRVGALPPGGERYEPLVVWAPADVAARIQTGVRPDPDAPPAGA